SPMTRVLIADGQLSFCHRLRQILERRRDIQVIAEASDASSAYTVMRQLRPDILLIDLGLYQQSAPLDPDGGGQPPPRTIVMLAAIDKNAIVEAFRFGAQGILLKTADPPMWGKTIRRAMDGQYCFENSSVTVLLEALRASFAGENAFSSKDYGLTTRELDIVTEIAAGHSNREVAQRFSICERTVKHHLTSIFDKVGVSNRVELALFAVKHRLVAAESVVRRPLEAEMASPGGQRSDVAAVGIL
ncbi:MAG: response regulator transcription factor, partial [Bryobacteraceae bacterium]